MILTHAALVSLALRCVTPSDAVPLLVRIIEGPENRARDTEIVGPPNSNGTYDYGIGRVNSGNFAMLTRLFGRPINAQTILDPCTNLAAAGAILIARYNGSQALPETGSAYVRAVINGPRVGITDKLTKPSPDIIASHATPSVDVWRVADTGSVRVEEVATEERAPQQPPENTESDRPPSWDVWATEEWRRQHADDGTPKEGK